MNKIISILFGLGLIVCGLLAMIANFFPPVFGQVARFSWPILIIGAGLVMCIAPTLQPEKRGLGGLFIPGVPLLTTGALLALANLFSAWWIWKYLWPVELMGIAGGFLLAALWMRVVWLVIPAFLVGVNSLVMQFCSVTGLWHWWSFLWACEPLALGLAFLVIALFRRSLGLMLCGLLFCGFAALAFAGMLVISTSAWWIFGSMASLAIILLGAGLLLWGLFAPRSRVKEAQQVQPASA